MSNNGDEIIRRGWLSHTPKILPRTAYSLVQGFRFTIGFYHANMFAHLLSGVIDAPEWCISSHMRFNS